MGIVSAIVGSALIGAGASAYSAKKSAKAAQQASDAATAEQQRQFDLIRADTAPYRQVGVDALNAIQRLYGRAPVGASSAPSAVGPADARTVWLSGPYGGRIPVEIPGQPGEPAVASPGPPATGRPDLSVFFESPDYQFNLAEGQKAIDRSLAARGRALSGAGVREGIRYASGLASQEFGNFYNRLASQAGLGQTAVGTSASAGMQTAANIGNAAMNAGNVRASAYMAGAQGVNSAIQGGIGNLLLMRYLSGGMTPGGGLG